MFKYDDFFGLAPSTCLYRDLSAGIDGRIVLSPTPTDPHVTGNIMYPGELVSGPSWRLNSLSVLTGIVSLKNI